MWWQAMSVKGSRPLSPGKPWSSNFSFDCPCSSPLKDLLPYKQLKMQTKCLGITRVEGAWEEHQVYDLVVDDPLPPTPLMGSSIVPLPLCTLGFVWQYPHDQGSKGPPSFVRYFHTCKSNPSYDERLFQYMYEYH